MDIITALRQSTAPKPIDLSGNSSTKKVALYVFAFLALVCIGGAIWWAVREPAEPEEDLPPVVDYRLEVLDAVKTSDAERLENLLQNASVSLDIHDGGRSLFCIALEQYKAAMKNFNLDEDISQCIGPMDVLDLLVKDQRCNVNTPFADGLSPLHYACLYCEDVLPELLKRSDLEKDVKDRDGKTPLHYGAENGPVSIVEKLCKARANVNILDSGNKSPLSRALARGNRICVLELYKYHPKITDIDKLEITKRGWTDVKELIFGDENSKSQLDFQFAVLEKIQEKRTAAQAGKFFTEKIKMIHDYISPASPSENTSPAQKPKKEDVGWLEKAKAAFEACKDMGASVLGASTVRSNKTKEELIDEFVDVMISSGSSDDDDDQQKMTCSMAVMNNKVKKIKAFTKDTINTPDKQGKYPIQYAYTDEAINALVEQGAKVDITDEGGNTLLHDAVFENNPQKIKALASKVDVNKRNLSGETPLLLAAKCKKINALKALLHVEKIDLKATDAFGNTVCHYVVSQGIDSVIFELITIKNADFSVENNFHLTPIAWGLQWAEQQKQSAGDVKKTILDLFRTYEQRKRGHYLLLATQLGWTDVIDELLKEPGSLNINYQDCHKKLTALHCAITANRLETLKHLLGKGADPNLKDSSGYTPIFYAAQDGRNAMIDELVKKGAKINEQEARSGQTILHKAVLAGHKDTVQHLVEKVKVDPNVCDTKCGWPPLFYAAYYCADKEIKKVHDYLGSTFIKVKINKKIQINGKDVDECDVLIKGAIAARNQKKKS